MEDVGGKEENGIEKGHEKTQNIMNLLPTTSKQKENVHTIESC